MSTGPRVLALVLLVAQLSGCGGGERLDPEDQPTVDAGPDAIATPRPAATPLPPDAQVRASLRDLRGVPSDGSRLGRASAPVELTVYASMDAFADRFFGRDLPEMLDRWVRPGQLRLSLVPVPDGARARLGSEYAAAAGLSGRMWQFWAALSARFEAGINTDAVRRALREAGVRGRRVTRDLRGKPVQRLVRSYGRADVDTVPSYSVRSRRGSARLDACGGLCLVQALVPVIEDAG